jgi:hypothetical protein
MSRDSHEQHNRTREERNRRRRAFKQLDPHDRAMIQRSMSNLAGWTKLSEMQAFDLLGAIAEHIAKNEFGDSLPVRRTMVE